jgi:ferrous iron transport protein A
MKDVRVDFACTVSLQWVIIKVAVSTSQSSLPLLKAAIGKWLRVIRFDAQPELANQLLQLGLLPGDCLRVVREAPLGGPLLVEFNGRSVALGRGVAQTIIVEGGEDECASH